MKQVLIALFATLLVAALIQGDESIREQTQQKILYSSLLQNGVSDSLIREVLTYRRLPEPDSEKRVCRVGRYLFVSADYEFVAILEYPDTCCYNIIPVYDRREVKK